MSDVNRYLEFLEENLDLIHLKKVKERIIKTYNYEIPDRVTVRIYYNCNDFSYFPYEETFNDMEKMMINELIPICESVRVRDDFLPSIRANYGVGILPSLFEAKVKIVNGNMPWVEPYGSVWKIKKLIDKGVPEFKKGLGGRIIETHKYYNEILANFPKCKEAIRIYHPDLQGPFDVAHLLWGPDIYYAVYDEPELLHELLDLITETYIGFLQEIKKDINDEEEGYVYHWGTLYKGRVVLRNDSAVNLSKEMYEEFVKPYDEKILNAFGGGSMHYCGRADQWIFSMLETRGLQALNFGQPPNLVFGLEFLSKVYYKAREKHIPIVNYNLDNKKIIEIPQSDFITGVTYSTYVEDINEAEVLLEALKLSKNN